MSRQISQTNKKGKLIHISLLIFSIAYILLANYYSKDQAILAGNVTYIPITIVLVTTSIYFLLEFGKKINMITLALLVASTISWFIAELVWTVEEMILQIEPFPSTADIFYVLGYPFLLVFLYNVGKTTKTTNQTRIISATVSMAFLIPTITAAFTMYEADPLYFALTATYTVFDTLLIWVILCNVLTVNNRQNSFWLFMFIGVGLLLIGDSFFITAAISEEYYTGHPIEIFFLAGYITISYGLYYQLKMSKKGENRLQLFSPDRPATNFLQNLVIVSSSIVVLIAVSLIIFLGFEEFTTNEATAFITMMATSVVMVIILSALTYILGKKLGVLKQLQKQYEGTHLPADVTPPNQLSMLLAKIERLEQNNKRMEMMTLFGVLITVIISAAYISENFFESNFEPQLLLTGRFVVENTEGVQVESDAFWQLVSDESLHVTITNSRLVFPDKIDAIRDAILSEETIDIQNSEIGKEPADLVSTYYVGWKGALQKASEVQTIFPIPTEFEIFESDESTGDVSIILSDQKQHDGSISSTKLIVDEGEHQIIKAYVTIFDVQNLDARDFEDVVRHEFGHAIGLKHQNQINMNLHEGHAYISQCNIENIIKLYNMDFSYTACD